VTSQNEDLLSSGRQIVKALGRHHVRSMVIHQNVLNAFSDDSEFGILVLDRGDMAPTDVRSVAAEGFGSRLSQVRMFFADELPERILSHVVNRSLDAVRRSAKRGVSGNQ